MSRDRTWARASEKQMDKRLFLSRLENSKLLKAGELLGFLIAVSRLGFSMLCGLEPLWDSCERRELFLTGTTDVNMLVTGCKVTKCYVDSTAGRRGRWGGWVG